MAHTCPGPDCKRSVPDSQLACRTHWFWVSQATRTRVWDAYIHYGRGSDEHTEAIDQAIQEMYEAQEQGRLG